MNRDEHPIPFLKEETVRSQYMITIPSQVQNVIFPGSPETKGHVYYWYIYEDDNEYVYISDHSSREQKATNIDGTEVHSGSKNRTSIPKEIQEKKDIAVEDSLYFFTSQGADQTPNPSVAVLTLTDFLNEMNYAPQNEEDTQIFREFRDITPGSMMSDPDPLIDRGNEPDFSVYADALLLIDALERHPVDNFTDVETNVLIDIYTLLSDVQKNSDNLRKSVADVLLDRLQHDRPVSGQFGSVVRTRHRNKTLKNSEEVLASLEAAGIDRERVTSVDPSKLDEVLPATELSESDVYEFEETEFVRKDEVDEDEKGTRFQDLID